MDRPTITDTFNYLLELVQIQASRFDEALGDWRPWQLVLGTSTALCAAYLTYSSLVFVSHCFTRDGFQGPRP